MSTISTETVARRKNPFEPDPNLKIWIDGELLPPSQAKISVFDHGLLYGDGIFEGIRIYNGRIFKEEQHIERFFQSAKALRLELPYTAEQISAAMHEAKSANGITDGGYIRLIATRGVGALGIAMTKAACPSIIVIAATIELYPPKLYDRGLNCIIPSTTRMPNTSLSPRIKSLNYLNNIMAKCEAHDAGADEAIMLNQQGQLAEGTGDNLFLINKGKMFTPPDSAGILAGITRKIVLELAENIGMNVSEKIIIPHDIYVADEAFLTGTAAEIIPVVSLNKRLIGEGTPGPVTRKLMAAFVEYRNRDCS